MSFEEEFDIEIPDDQVENIKTVGDIVKYIEENVDWDPEINAVLSLSCSVPLLFLEHFA